MNLNVKEINGNILLKLMQQIERVLNRSEFYRKKYAVTKLRTLPSIALFESLPFTSKSEILTDQEKYPPFGSNLCIDMKRIRRIHKTSGTTNRPVIVAMSSKDINHTIKVGSLCFKTAGLKSSDIVIHCLNYNMWAGGYTDHQSLEGTGAAVIPFGVGHTKNLIETILRIKPTAIHCTPSYMSALEILLTREFNVPPIQLGLELGLFGAESGLQNRAFRQKLEEVWGMRAMNANYGMSEVLSMIGAESVKQDGLSFLAGDVLYPELLDRKGGCIQKIEQGAIGELVLTNLCKEAQPLIRYRTGDIIKILSDTREGEAGFNFRFEVIGRSDDMLVIKGINFFVSSIDFVINKHLDDITDIYEVYVNATDPIDRIVIRLETRYNFDFSKKEKLISMISNDFREQFSIKPEIEIVNEGTLPRAEGKRRKLYRTL